ncbi:MAG: MFS transporter [Candidatus Heimdallarchaeota archaeon]|nr:MFS transporter [Candidatus Heimdallarchaeota archaeon]
MDPLKKNTWIFFYTKIGWIALFLTSVVLTWQKYGLSFSEILFLQGLFGLFLLIFEFPSGVIADLKDRKNIVSVGFLFLSIGSLIYSIADSYILFVVSEAVLAMGLASISGSETANLWDTYLEFSTEDNAKSVVAKSRSLQIFSSAILLGSGSLLGLISLKLPFLITAMGYLVGAILWYKAYEPQRSKLEKPSVVMRDSISLLKNPKYLEAIAGILFIGITLRILFWAYIPQMQIVGIKENYFGIFISSGGLIAGIVSWRLAKTPNYGWKVPISSYFSIFFGALIFILPITISLLVIALILHQFSRGVLQVHVAITVNEVANSEIRASAASLNASIGSGVYLLVTLFMDLLDQSLQASLVSNFIFFCVILLLISILKINSYKSE